MNGVQYEEYALVRWGWCVGVDVRDVLLDVAEADEIPDVVVARPDRFTPGLAHDADRCAFGGAGAVDVVEPGRVA